MFKFEDLKVYQKSLDFVNDIYEVSSKWPKTELFGLTSQFKRAATSIALNIAEGSGRKKRDFCRFLDFARGSCYECATILSIAKRRKYLNNNQCSGFREELIIISKMLSGLKRSLTN